MESRRINRLYVLVSPVVNCFTFFVLMFIYLLGLHPQVYITARDLDIYYWDGITPKTSFIQWDG